MDNRIHATHKFFTLGPDGEIIDWHSPMAAFDQQHILNILIVQRSPAVKTIVAPERTHRVVLCGGVRMLACTQGLGAAISGVQKLEGMRPRNAFVRNQLYLYRKRHSKGHESAVHICIMEVVNGCAPTNACVDCNVNKTKIIDKNVQASIDNVCVVTCRSVT